MKRRDSMGIAGMIADANKILWQNGLTLVQSGAVHYLNNDAWLDHVNVLAETNAVIDAMMDSTNSMGNAVELYFVETLEGGDAAGLCWPEGIVIAAIGDGQTLAHEVMHDCGLEDIYTIENHGGSDPNPVSGPVSEERIPADWGGGYYPPGLQQADFNSGRLLMYGRGDPETTVAINIPRGSVYGVGVGSPAQTNLVLGPVSVGRNSMEPGEPVH